jgi:hypothetical protein
MFLEALWAYRTTWRNTTRFTPYNLVYGKQILLPIEFQVKTFRIIAQLEMNLLAEKQQRILQLNELNEVRHDDIQQTSLVQQKKKIWQDKFIKKKQFKSSDWALLFVSNFKILKGNISTCW